MTITPELFKVSRSNSAFLSVVEATKCVKFQSARCKGFQIDIFRISPIELVYKQERGGSKGCSVWLLEAHIWQGIFHFQLDLV